MDAYDGCMMRRMRNQALFRRTDARSSEDSDIGRCGPGYAANASSVLLSYVHIVCCAHMSHICVCALSVALCECVLSLLLFVVSRGLSPSPSLPYVHRDSRVAFEWLVPRVCQRAHCTERAAGMLRCIGSLQESLNLVCVSVAANALPTLRRALVR